MPAAIVDVNLNHSFLLSFFVLAAQSVAISSFLSFISPLPLFIHYHRRFVCHLSIVLHFFLLCSVPFALLLPLSTDKGKMVADAAATVAGGSVG